MLTGVASSMVAFVGKEKTPLKSEDSDRMEIDQESANEQHAESMASNAQSMTDIHLSEFNYEVCGQFHPGNASEGLR